MELRCRELLCSLGLAASQDRMEVVPLPGGVASDIAQVTVGKENYCVKFALEKLKVEEDWRVPVHRNLAEYAWLQFAEGVDPSAVPRLYGQSETGFAMEFLAPSEAVLWKDQLLRETPETRHAAAVGSVLGRIHAASALSDTLTEQFSNHEDFLAIRIEPYLLFTASKHPGLARRLKSLGESLYRSRTALVHGDVSPKNILFRGDSPVLLDAECATAGDPAFDVSFLMNHLILKSVHRPGFADALLECCTEFWNSYSRHISWEPDETLEIRAASLIPALMLARVDGKSPVEYLSLGSQARVRSLANSLILKPPPDLIGLLSTIRSAGKAQ